MEAEMLASETASQVGCGIAVGSSEVTLIRMGEAREVSEKLPIGEAAVQTIVAACGECKLVVIAGNRVWGTTLAHALRKQGIAVRYLGGPATNPGVRFSYEKMLRTVLEKNEWRPVGQPFFRTSTGPTLTEEESSSPWVKLARDYEATNDEVRRAKHRVLDGLRVIFPELLQLGEKLWRKDALEAIRTGAYGYFLEHNVDETRSIANCVPPEERQEASEKIAVAIDALRTVEYRKATLAREVARVTEDHSAFRAYGAFSASMVVLLALWKKWGSTKQCWRRLRSYAGFAVTRVDGKGKPRIGRQRPVIRVFLYHLMKSRRGKAIIAAAIARLGKDGLDGRKKMKRIERMEYILKDLWRLASGISPEVPVDSVEQ